MLAVMLVSEAANDGEGESTRKVGGVNQLSARAFYQQEGRPGSKYRAATDFLLKTIQGGNAFTHNYRLAFTFITLPRSRF